MPQVRARFYLGGSEIYAVNVPGSGLLPAQVDEGDLSKSANATIPGDVIQPGLEMVVEVDPAGTLDPALGVPRRIPAMGRLAVDVRSMPRFDLTVIPFLGSQAPDSSIIAVAEAMAADPQGHELLWETRALMPVGDLAVRAHEPVVISADNGFAILSRTRAIRAMEGGVGHYLGTSATVTRPLGVADLPGRASFAVPAGWIIAHELGHNFFLLHAPCGVGGDSSYPYSDGAIGVWGYDFRNGGSLVPPSQPDLMSYCQDRWISDYSFTNALRYRLIDEGPGVAHAAAPTRSLLLWGGVDSDAVPFLEPAFVVDAPPLLPDSAGAYRMAGVAGDGAELFSLSFAMSEWLTETAVPASPSSSRCKRTGLGDWRASRSTGPEDRRC